MNTDSSNGQDYLIQQLTDALKAQTKALLTIGGAQPPMTRDQARVELRFRALLNALGGFERRPQLADVALMPPPTLIVASNNTFYLLVREASVPENAHSVLVTYREDKEIKEKRHPLANRSNGQFIVPNVGDVINVQIDDIDQKPLRFGIPFRKSQSVVTTEPARYESDNTPQE